MERIAYITSSFGSLSHTFIRREVIELRRLGMDIYLFGIRPERAKELSSEDVMLEKETIYIYPLNFFRLIFANIYFIVKRPFDYFKTLFQALLNEEMDIFKHIKLVYHFFVSPCIAFAMYQKGIQHIHAHFLNAPATIAIYCSKLLGISFSITIHSAGEKGLKSMIGLKRKLREAKFICVISDYNKEYINNAIYPCREKTHVVRCGLDIDDYGRKDNYRLTEGAEKIKLLSIGRFVEKKGFKYLIDAAELLRKENIAFELRMIGGGPLKREVEEAVKRYNLEREVIFMGELPHEEVKKELIKSDILVVPSAESGTGEKEGIPVIIMEAMATGVFVIATEHSGIPEIVKDKITGMLVPEKNPMSIKEAIKSLARDNNLMKTGIDNARRLVSEEFDIKKIAKQKKKIFEENI